MWTRFMDMHSGGPQKEKWAHIYIEAEQEEAKVIFYNRFGHSPDRVSCTCCGEDYTVDESPTIEEASAFNRNCEYVYFRPDGTECDEREGFVIGKGTRPGYRSGYVERQNALRMKIRNESRTNSSDKWGLYQTIDEYRRKPDVLIIPASDIKRSERTGSIPEQGYVWRD